MSNLQLADNLRYLRRKQRLTQEDLSRMLNISRQAYSNYENNKRTPDLDTLLYLSNFYKISLSDLMLCNLRDRSVSARVQKLDETKVPYLCAKSKKTGNSIYLSEEELDFIVKFRSLSPENKQMVTGFLFDAE